MMNIAGSLALAGLLAAGCGSGRECAQDGKDPAARTAAATAPDFVRADGKTTLALFTGSDWCIWCKRLEGEVLSTPEFKKALEDKYALETLDFPSDESKIDKATAARNAALMKKYGVRGFPTIVVFDAKGRRLCTLGYKRGGARAWLEYAEAEIKRATSAAGKAD